MLVSNIMKSFISVHWRVSMHACPSGLPSDQVGAYCSYQLFMKPVPCIGEMLNMFTNEMMG